MDTERTIEFLLQQQAKADGQIEAIRKLVLVGMEMLNKHATSIQALADSHLRVDESLSGLAESQKRTDERIRALSEAQIVTEEKLQRFIDSLGRQPGNGH